MIGTRKGAFRVERGGDRRWAIGDTWFLGDPVSLVLAEPGGQRLHAALALGHFGVKIQRSEDGGVNWGEAPAPAYPEKPDGIEDKDPMRGIDLPWSTQLIWSLTAGAPGELWCGTIPGGLFRSCDAGANWRELVDVPPSSFGFAVAVHPSDPDTAWFVPATKDEQRIPVGARLVVTRTRDGGRSFEVLRAGLPNEHAYDLVYRHALDVSADGDGKMGPVRCSVCHWDPAMGESAAPGGYVDADDNPLPTSQYSFSRVLHGRHVQNKTVLQYDPEAPLTWMPRLLQPEQSQLGDHRIPGQVWHIAHGCHRKAFLLKFARDRKQWESRRNLRGG